MDESRPVGEHERLLHYMHRFGALITLVALHVRGPLDADIVTRALAWLQRQHPMLRAHIRYGRPVFRDLPPFVYLQPWLETAGTQPIPLRVATGDWEAVMEKELATPLRRGKTPRMRVTLVPEGELTHLIITADHATLDAQSINLMSRQLLEYVADPAATEAKPPLNERLPPPSEAGLPKKSDSGAKAYEPALRIPRHAVPRRKPVTRVLARRIAADTAAGLKATARDKGATLHGAIAGAFLLAMREKYGVKAMTLLSTLDLRRLSKPTLPAETYGCYIDILRTRHDISPELWRTARDVSFKLVGAVAKDQETASILKLPPWAVYRYETIPIATHNLRIDGLAVTTAGDSGLRSHYGNHALEDVTAAVSLDVFGPSLMVIANERNGAIDLSINFATRALGEAEAEELTAHAIATLEHAAQPVLEAVS